MKAVKNVIKQAYSSYDYLTNKNKVKQILSESNKNQHLHQLFGKIDDELWYWILTEGHEAISNLAPLLPKMPENHIQEQFTGNKGKDTLRQAFLFYKLIKTISTVFNRNITEHSKILDFGCGWGRIIRFFLKETNPTTIFGIDPYKEVLEICKSSNLNCQFQLINPAPPTQFSDNSFDLIYAYSVFSHLSEQIQKSWLAEFERILKPGGLVVVTTRPKDFIVACSKFRKMSNVPFYATGGAASFLNTEESLKDYDNGKYCFSPTGGGGVLDSSFYGETCIPRKYVYQEWKKYFTDVDFIDYRIHKSFDQNVIIAQK